MKNLVLVDVIALLLVVVGGLNWGLVGLFQFDLVAFLFGGFASGVIARILYVVVALAAVWVLVRVKKFVS